MYIQCALTLYMYRKRTLSIFLVVLQESELECIQLQSKVDQFNEEKERLLNSLVEAE